LDTHHSASCPLSLHDALPISAGAVGGELNREKRSRRAPVNAETQWIEAEDLARGGDRIGEVLLLEEPVREERAAALAVRAQVRQDRKSTRLNSSHERFSDGVC